MKSKQQKKKELKALEAKLPDSQITIFTSFAHAGEKGLSVAQMTELKRGLRANGSEYMVTKKTLIDRALHDKGVDVFGMDGSLGLVIGKSEPYGLAKQVYDFAKKNQALQFFGALMDGKFLTKEEFLEIAKMPSREVLIARLLGMMSYPISGLYIVMSELAKKMSAEAPAEAAPQAETPTESAPTAEEAPAQTPEQQSEAPASETAPAEENNNN
ncbi:MAG TPA: 50S ribosomal protein L10 [Candidatus Paceibacterota bacterium]|nr:50S ribosomal protein L10 [Candidatus Paceibacterota bacterium]